MTENVSITMEEATKLRRETEDEITRILTAFETRTGLIVEEVEYDQKVNGVHRSAQISVKL